MAEEKEERVRPDVFMASLLDEIAGRLVEILDTQRLQIPEGIVEPIPTFKVTQKGKTIKLDIPWFSFAMWNDGPNTFWVQVNKKKRGKAHELKKDETYSVNMGAPKIKDLYLYCATGETAAVRIAGDR